LRSYSVRHGAGYATELQKGLESYLQRKEVDLDTLRGMLAGHNDVGSSKQVLDDIVGALDTRGRSQRSANAARQCSNPRQRQASVHWAIWPPVWMPLVPTP
jgi:hypothetical protein